MSRQSFAVFHDNLSRVAIDRSEQKARSETQSLSAPAVIEKLHGNSYVFTEDYAFTFITAAAHVVSGQTARGAISWKTADTNQIFAEWEESQITQTNDE